MKRFGKSGRIRAAAMLLSGVMLFSSGGQAFASSGWTDGYAAVSAEEMEGLMLPESGETAAEFSEGEAGEQGRIFLSDITDDAEGELFEESLSDEADPAAAEVQKAEETAEEAVIDTEEDALPAGELTDDQDTALDADTTYILICKNKGYQTLGNRIAAADQNALVTELRTNTEDYLEVSLFAGDHPSASIMLAFYADNSYEDSALIWRGVRSGKSWTEEEFGSALLSSTRIYARFVARYVITLNLADADATISTVSSGDVKYSAPVVTSPKTDTDRGNVQYIMTLDTEDEAARTFPTPTCTGYGFKGWLNGTKTEQTNKIIPSQIVNLTLTAQWSVASRVEFYLGDAEFSDQATYQSGYLETPGEVSKLKRYEDRPVDGVIYVANGTALGKGFSTVTRGTFEAPPSLDPVPADSFHAIFRGWRISSSPEVLYTSDALSKVVVNGPVYVWAEWDTDDVVHIVFQGDGEEKWLEDAHRRETERSEFVYNAKQNKDLRDQFINKSGWVVYGVPGDPAMLFAGWKVEGSLAETSWKYNQEEVTLVPMWTDSKSTVIGVRFTGVKIGNKTNTTHEIYPTVGTKVTMTAATLGGSTTDITWSVYDVDDEGIETPAGKDNVISLLAKKNGTENTFTAKKTGTVIVEIRAVVGDFNVRDRLIVHVRPGTKSLYMSKKKYVAPKEGEEESEEGTTEALECKLRDQSYGDSMVIHDTWYASLVPTAESQLTERIYISSTHGFYVDDDFFRIQGVQLDPATDRWYLETDKKRCVTVEILVPSKDESNLEDFQKKAHAGSTTLTFTTEDGALKRTMKLTVAGYDEDSRRFYKPDGTYVKNVVQRIHGGEYSPLPEGDDRDCYFDFNGIGHIDEEGNTGGLIRRYDGKWILIDNLTIDNKRRYKWVNGPDYPGTIKAQEYKYPYGGDDEAARYFVSLEGVVLSGWQTFQQESRTKTKYYDPKDLDKPFQPKVESWVETNKKRYYVDEEGCRVEGKREIGENWYCFNSNVAGMKDDKGKPLTGTPGVPRDDNKKPGQMLTGWVPENGLDYVWWYDPDTGIRAPTDTVVEDNKKLYFNSTKIGKVMPTKPGWLVYNEDMAYTVEDYPADLVITGVNDYYITAKTGELARNKLMTPLKGCSWYFDNDGHTVRGPRKVGGKQYYFDPNNNNMAATRTEDIKGFYIRMDDGSRGSSISFHQDPTDGKTNQKWTYDDTRVVVDKEWALAYLYTEDEEGDEVVLPNYYYIVKGKMVTGWKTIKKQKYFFGDDCALVTATAPTMPDDVADILAQRTGKTSTWVKNHRMNYYSDMVTINGKKFYLSGTGELLKNRWVHEWAIDDGPDGAIYYAGANGKAVTGKKTIKVDGVSRVFFFHANTAQKFETDLVRVGKTLYMLDSSEGYAVIKPEAAGWEGGLYVNKNGTVKTGWVTAKGDDDLRHTWYFTKEGEMLTGVDVDMRIDGKNVYGFASDGVRLKKEWDDDEDRWFNAAGKAVTGRKKIDGLWYIFRTADDEKDESQKKGMCYKDCYVKLKNVVYHLGPEGFEIPIGQTQIVQAIDGNEYMVNARGVIMTGIQTDKGSRNAGYYDKNGVRGKDGFYEVSSGRWVYVDETGTIQTDVYATVRTVGDSQDSGNLLYKKASDDNRVITAFMNDKKEPLKNALITVNNDETRQYIIDGNGRIATGWYSYRNDTPNAKDTGRRYKYYIKAGGRLYNTQAQHLAEIQKDGNPLLKVDGLQYYQTEDGVIMALDGKGKGTEPDIRPAMLDDDTETGYYVNVAGVVQFSKKLKVIEQTVFVNADGFRATGWCYADNEWYYVEDGEPQSTAILGAASLGEMTFVNTSTGLEFDATCATGFAGYQTEVWKSLVEKNGKLVEEPITGTWESTEPDEKGRITVYTFVKGVMKTGKISVFDSVSHAKVNRNFNAFTGKATYKVYQGNG